MVIKMRFRKITTYLTFLSLPFAFVSCSIGTSDPNPFYPTYPSFGFRRNGMKDWESIFKEYPNKSRPDYCYFESRQGYATLNCFERINGSNSFSEDTKFQRTRCSRNNEFHQNADWKCRNPSPTEISDLDSYKKLMRYAGDGSPTVGEEFHSKLSQTFIFLGSFAFLSFPFLLVTTLFIYLVKKKKITNRKNNINKK